MARDGGEVGLAKMSDGGRLIGDGGMCWSVVIGLGLGRLKKGGHFRDIGGVLRRNYKPPKLRWDVLRN